MYKQSNLECESNVISIRITESDEAFFRQFAFENGISINDAVLMLAKLGSYHQSQPLLLAKVHDVLSIAKEIAFEKDPGRLEELNDLEDEIWSSLL